MQSGHTFLHFGHPLVQVNGIGLFNTCWIRFNFMQSENSVVIFMMQKRSSCCTITWMNYLFYAVSNQLEFPEITIGMSIRQRHFASLNYFQKFMHQIFLWAI